MDWQAFIEAVRAWFAGATGLTTIIMYQKGGRPDYPYAAMHVDKEGARGIDELRQAYDPTAGIGKEVSQTIVGNRVIPVTLQTVSMGKDEETPDITYISQAYRSLHKPSIKAMFSAAGIGVVRCSEPTHRHEIVNQDWVTIWMMNLELSAGISDDDDPATYIESMTFNEAFVGASTPGHLDKTITLLVDNDIVSSPWEPNFTYVAGEFCKNDSAPLKLYKCITSGISAASGGPTGTSTDITDYHAHWRYVAPVNLGG
jgi:hypothetical protein